MNVPKLRFKEFNDEWKNNRIEELFKLSSGTTPATTEKNNYVGDINWISSGELKPKYINKTINRISKKISQSMKIYPKGTLLIALYGLEAEGVRGTASILNIESTISQACMAFEPLNSNITNEFMYYWYKNNGEWIGRKIAQGTKQQNLTSELIKPLIINYPYIVEQNKISNTLQLLDKKIELQTKKIEALKLFKLGLAKSVFNSSKANIDLKLKDIALIEKGKQVNGEQLLDKGNYYVLNGGINPSGFLNEYNREENTITISEGGNSCGYVSFNKSKFWCGGHCYSLSPININNQYLYHLLKYHEIKIMNLRVGSGLPNIQKKDLENISIKIHSDKDQKNISSFLSKYDKKLYFENKKLKSLNNLKKGLLQKMFV